MLSARKRQLVFAERAGVTTAAACLLVALLVSAKGSLAFVALPLVFVSFAVVFYLALLIAGITNELLRAFGRPTTADDDGAGLSVSEIRRQLRWSPRLYKIGAAAAVVGIAVTALLWGPVSWSTGQTFTPRHAVASLLYLCFVILLELPVIASAARMPGTFGENLMRAPHQ